MLGSQLGQMVGVTFGQYLGRQITLGACREDRDDDFPRRPFVARIPSHAIPAAVDLRRWMTPVEDQGALGSCAANAVVGAMEYLVRRESGAHVDLSRLFVYYNQRLWDDSVRDDLGASIADGVRVVSRVGVPRETSWPYARDLFAVQPPEPIYAEGARTKALDWWSIPVQADAFRGCLAAGFPIVIGTRVTESFVQTGRDGRCGMPRGADDRRHGRHAMLVVGYEDKSRVFVVRNSWGADWGDDGYVYMPYEYVLEPRWTSGCWAIRLTVSEAFDPGEHGAIDLRSLPSAPPGASGSTAIAGGVASMGAQAVVGAFTGSGLLAGLAGGLVRGLTPGVANALRKDRGAFVGRERSAEILAALRADGAPPVALAHYPWDDGLDEESLLGAVGSQKNFVSSAAPEKAPAAPSKPASPAFSLPDPALIDTLPEHIAEVWRRDGGQKGPLGMPTAKPAPMQEGAWRGTAACFVDGAMFAWDPPPGQPRARPITLLLREPAYAKWVAIGAAHGVCGWPVAEIEATPDGHAKILRCARGSILDHPTHGVHPIHGAIFALWQQLGGLASNLGYPIADPDVPADASGTISLRFEQGTLSWSPSRGAWRS